MSGFLDEMAQASRERVAAAKKLEPYPALLARAQVLPHPLALRLSPQGFDIIAELKLRSPAQGQLGARADDWPVRIEQYCAGGAAAVSVLTEPSRFDGSLDDVSRAAGVASALRVPVMRKDFLVDPYQVLEARVHGAAGALVILRMLTLEQIVAMLDVAASLGMFVLLEAFDRADLELANSLAGAGRHAGETILIGVNCRDLQTLELVPARFEELARELPRSWPSVAESGVTSPAEAARMAALGYRLALVGTALMSHDTPHALLRDMLAAARHSPH